MNMITELRKWIECFFSLECQLLRFEHSILVSVIGLDSSGTEIVVETPYVREFSDQMVFKLVSNSSLDPNIRIGVNVSFSDQANRNKHYKQGFDFVKHLTVLKMLSAGIQLTLNITCHTN